MKTTHCTLFAISCLLLATLTLTSATPSFTSMGSCSVNFPNGVSYDLSSLTTPTGTRVKGNQSDIYSINFCAVAQGDNQQDACTTDNAAVCVNYIGAAAWYVLGSLNAPGPMVQQIEVGNVPAIQLTYDNGVYGPNTATTVVQVICSSGPTTYSAQQTFPNNWFIQVESPAGCPVTPAAPVVVADDEFSCQWTATDGNQFDFSSLSSTNGVDIAGNSTYWLNPCGIKVASKNNTSTNSNACLENNATVCLSYPSSPQVFAIADMNSAPAFSELIPGDSSRGVMLSFDSGFFGQNPARVDLLFLCDADAQTTYDILTQPDQDTLAVAAYERVNTSDSDDVLHWVVSITSPAACQLAKSQPVEKSIFNAISTE